MANKKMWSGIIFFGMIMAAMLTGCATTYRPIKNLAANEECQLYWQTGYISINGYDGNQVSWSQGLLSFGALSKTTVHLPVGTHTLTGNYNDGTNHANGISITHEFEAGHVYWLTYEVSGRSVNFVIYDTTRPH